MENKHLDERQRNDRTMQAYRALSQFESDHRVGCRVQRRARRGKSQQKAEEISNENAQEQKTKRCSHVQKLTGSLTVFKTDGCESSVHDVVGNQDA